MEGLPCPAGPQAAERGAGESSGGRRAALAADRLPAWAGPGSPRLLLRPATRPRAPAAAARLLLPPKFLEREPQRCCGPCAEVLAPLQPLLAGTVSPAVQPPVHDTTDWSVWRSLLNSPLTQRLEDDIFKRWAFTFSCVLSQEGRASLQGCACGLKWRGCSARAAVARDGARGSAMLCMRRPCARNTGLLLPAPLVSTSTVRVCALCSVNIVRHFSGVGGFKPERGIPEAVLAGTAGLAILSVLKVGAGWSCGMGTGLVVARRADGSWSAPSSVLSVSAGAAGGESVVGAGAGPGGGVGLRGPLGLLAVVCVCEVVAACMVG